MSELIRISPQDMVAVALAPIGKGRRLELDGLALTARDDIPAGHKLALRDIARGEKVIKYGFPIGEAKRDILAGEHVHTAELKTLLSGELSYEYRPNGAAVKPAPPESFMGYCRERGRAGVRNELWILPTVGCVNDVALALERRAQTLAGGGVEGVHAFTHPYGCSQMGEDQENTRRILADLAVHPNAGGVLVLGLGCENSGVEHIRALMGEYDPSRVRFLVCQQVEDELEAGMEALCELAARMKDERRSPCSTCELVVGLKCGGSDGLSGVTANPVIGGFSDMLIARGGGTMLTEVPEMFGAETILMDRCKDERVFNKTVSLINDFKRYFEANNQTIYENPSPGNKEGGISTLEDKALGCTQKSGFAPVVDVLAYGERAKEQGLNLLNAPGNDLVASTALAASGAQIVLFSTGRGTPFASPVPTVKISSNTPLALKKRGWIDFNAGELLEGETLEGMSRKLLRFVLETAGGALVQSEKNGYHSMAIFKTGVTL